MKTALAVSTLLLTLAAPGCADVTVDANGYVYQGLANTLDGPDHRALSINGYAASPGAPVIIYGQHCSLPASFIELDQTTASPNSSFTADMLGQQGYAFDFTIDATEIGGINDNGGCFELLMIQHVPGQGWSNIATFDDNVGSCPALQQNLSYLETIEACRRPSDWLRYSFQYLG
ncbi:MAG: hypothetical protein K0V04_38180 [Deltaproteobacteria bacterium]|nr:hypothetical protein [Deltaproteobacteria bacterium]